MNLKELYRNCVTPIRDPKFQDAQRRAMLISGSILSLVCCLISTLNLRNGYTLMTMTTIILTIGFVFGTVLCYYRKMRASSMLSVLLVIFIFTYYAVSGANDGFALLWILLVPMFCIGFYGVPIGISVGLYFLILLIGLFYTPLRIYMRPHYTEAFLIRFPVLYFADFIGISVFMIQRHLVQLRQESYAEELNEAVIKERERVSEISLQTIRSISNTVDAKDRYTQRHSARVAEYSCEIARSLGWDEKRIDNLRQIALLHDIGKIAVGDAILNKPSRLTNEEYEIMKSHTTAGGMILKDLTLIENVSVGATYHHERYDGNGYPNGLKGEEIPIEARIIGIADAFDAMNSNRIYRASLTAEKIREELVRGSGSQFDPDLLEVFLPIADKYLFDDTYAALPLI